MEFASVLANTKNKFFSLKMKNKTVTCKFSSYINGRFILKIKNEHKIVSFDDIQEIKSKGIIYTVEK